MRIAVAVFAYFLTLAVSVVVTFFGVLFLAGPHGGVLPNAAQPAVLVLGWAIVLFVPPLAARWAWRRLAVARKSATR